MVVVGLGDRGVRLVAPGGRDALPLVVDARGRPERLLQAMGPVEGRRPPEPVDVPHGLGDVDPPLLAHLLLDDLHREQRSEILRADGLERARVDHRRERRGQVRLDVVPAARQVLLVQQELGLGHGNLLRALGSALAALAGARRSAASVARASASAYAWRPASSAKRLSGMRWSANCQSRSG